MADAVLVRQGVHVEAIGKSVTVPDNNIARLMYYLSCMSTCLEDFIPSEFTNYQNYYSISDETKTAVVALALLLDPEKILGKIVFVVPPGNPLLNDHNNEFYRITEATQVLAGTATVEGTIIIEGRKVDITKIMVCTENWYHKFLLNPLKDEIWRLQDDKPRSTYTPSYISPSHSSPSHSSPSHSSPSYSSPSYSSPSYSSPSPKKKSYSGETSRSRWGICCSLLAILCLLLAIAVPLWMFNISVQQPGYQCSVTVLFHYFNYFCYNSTSGSAPNTTCGFCSSGNWRTAQNNLFFPTYPEYTAYTFDTSGGLLGASLVITFAGLISWIMQCRRGTSTGKYWCGICSPFVGVILLLAAIVNFVNNLPSSLSSDYFVLCPYYIGSSNSPCSEWMGTEMQGAMPFAITLKWGGLGIWFGVATFLPFLFLCGVGFKNRS